MTHLCHSQSPPQKTDNALNTKFLYHLLFPLLLLPFSHDTLTHKCTSPPCDAAASPIFPFRTAHTLHTTMLATIPHTSCIARQRSHRRSRRRRHRRLRAHRIRWAYRSVCAPHRFVFMALVCLYAGGWVGRGKRVNMCVGKIFAHACAPVCQEYITFPPGTERKRASSRVERRKKNYEHSKSHTK